jgi:hypothetical protein
VALQAPASLREYGKSSYVISSSTWEALLRTGLYAEDDFHRG